MTDGQRIDRLERLMAAVINPNNPRCVCIKCLVDDNKLANEFVKEMNELKNWRENKLIEGNND